MPGNPYIQTVSGRKFFPLNPRAEDIDILDIAHALSMKCRFAGHCTSFYSVAQHSVLVSNLLPPHLQLCGLLHDAGEAYFADIPKPIKMEYPEFSAIEDKIMYVVAAKYGFSWPEHPEVKAADNAMLATEARDLLSVRWDDYDTRWASLSVASKVIPLLPHDARDLFYQKFYLLTTGAEIRL
jgi:hypothetical protein